MGRIKTTLIKRNVITILNRYKDRFKPDFKHNKKMIEEVAEISSKKLRNIMAGYITRLVKREK